MGNLPRPQSGASSAIQDSDGTAQPDVVLGLPFLRSVYVAYRFPTDDCPGYYGFAFPSGANRTRSQISQTLTTTPSNSAQSLAPAALTSTPTANVVMAHEACASRNKCAVYSGQGGDQVPLLGVDDLPKMV